MSYTNKQIQILKAFRIEELDNPITAESIANKMTLLDCEESAKIGLERFKVAYNQFASDAWLLIRDLEKHDCQEGLKEEECETCHKC